jgi:hypothetical protein
VFLHPVRSAGHVVHSSVSGARNIDALFLMLEWAYCGVHKYHARTRYAELVFLHPVDQRVTSCNPVCLEHEMSTQLFFMLGWDWYRFDKNLIKTSYAEF